MARDCATPSSKGKGKAGKGGEAGGGGSPGQGVKGNKGLGKGGKSNLHCTKCRKTGHTVERCREIYPELKRGPRKKINGVEEDGRGDWG